MSRPVIKRGYQSLEVDFGVVVRLNIGIRHSSNPVEAVSIAWRETGQRAGTYHALVQQSSASERVWGASRPSYHAKLIDSKVIGDGLYIVSGISDNATVLPGRPGIAGAAVTDQSDTEPIEHNSSWSRTLPAARGAVQQENRLPIRVTPAFNRQNTIIRDVDHVGHGSLPCT
jgi:hypothetical protein